MSLLRLIEYLSLMKPCCSETKASPSHRETVEHVQEKSDLKRAEFLLLEAMEDDEAGNSEGAVEQYMEAVELCLKAVRLRCRSAFAFRD